VALAGGGMLGSLLGGLANGLHVADSVNADKGQWRVKRAVARDC
jgi:predicted lipid-binding transport protein (Tim44 family)